MLVPVLLAALAGADASADRLGSLVEVLASVDDDAVRRDVLRGMVEALQGRRGLKAPRGWSDVYRKLTASADAEVREKAMVLAVVFGDRQAVDAMRKTAADPRADTAARRLALQTLVDNQAPDLLPLLKDLLTDRSLRARALRGLAVQGDAGVPALVLKHYASFDDADRAEAVAVLTSRPAYAQALLDAMEKGTVPRRDLSAFAARQLLALKDKALAERLARVWGTIRATAKDKGELLARYQSLVPPDALKKADRSRGRQLFARTCAACHVLFGEGGKIGPELTGAQRTNPEYLLTKVLDPNAVVARDYQMTVITTTKGRTLSGIVKEEDEKTLTLVMEKETLRLAKAEIDDRQATKLSLMPEGLLAKLSDEEVRDLIAYLAGSGQVPLPRERWEPGAPTPGASETRTLTRSAHQTPARHPAAPKSGGKSLTCPMSGF
jgi:putative heme-binding domain-containing protein